MARRPFAAYLTESLASIEAGAPAAYALLRRTLGTRRVRLDVGGEVLGLQADESRIAVTAGEGPAEVDTWTTRAAIVALADGEVTLEQAVLEERMDLQGTVDDLLAGVDALSAYLSGAARCPELIALMDDFRSDVGDAG